MANVFSDEFCEKTFHISQRPRRLNLFFSSPQFVETFGGLDGADFTPSGADFTPMGRKR